MSAPRIPREEFVRQLRASAPVMVERWIADALTQPDMPAEFEVGACIHMVFHLDVRPMDAVPPNRITCDGPDCRAAIEFLDASPAQVAEALDRRGWAITTTPESIWCPRCKAAALGRS